jgi:hypothetical protein
MRVTPRRTCVHAESSESVTSTTASFNTCSGIVFLMVNCSTTWSGKMCFTTSTRYSSSDSVSGTTRDDRNTAPMDANAGILYSAAAWLESSPVAAAESADAAAPPAASEELEGPPAPADGPLTAAVAADSHSGTPTASKPLATPTTATQWDDTHQLPRHYRVCVAQEQPVARQSDTSTAARERARHATALQQRDNTPATGASVDSSCS